MSITYPIYLPFMNLKDSGATILISSMRFKPRSVVAMSISPFTGQQQVQVHQGQIWAAEIKLPPLKADEAQQLLAALLSLNGIQGKFYLGDPAHRAPGGNPTGDPVVDGAGQTGQTLSTKGWGQSDEGVLLAGDWIQLGTGLTQRIYRVLKDVDSGADGKAIIDIWPRLRESPGNEESLVLEDTMGVFRMSDNEMLWDIEPGLIYGFEFSVVEAVEYEG
jgi:hypothetical protein